MGKKHKQNMQRRPSMGKGHLFGGGHSGHSNLPPLVKLEMPAEWYMNLEPNSQSYRLGQCSVIIAPPYLSRGYHLTIAHRSRYPTWDEIAKAWYDGVPGAENRIACMVLPTKDKYINYHEFCFQVLELQQGSDDTIVLVGKV